VLQSHQLAAVMFTDIVGYTSFMGFDEERAFELLHQNRAMQKPLIEKYEGRLIKELGDGILASFSTVTKAVMCAGYILHSCKGIPDLELRISIHLGEVVFEENDIYGDGVNIASRIITLAPPGSIYISEPVHANVINKKGITTNFIKSENLKNVKEPVRIYEVFLEIPDEPVKKVSEDTGNTPLVSATEKVPEKSIAVLPFVNMSNDPEQEYFSDGITEEILNSLTHVKSLRVASRTSSFYFKGKNIDLREIGKQLNVQNVLEGSVRKQGNKLRITAQLINAENGFHLWSEHYDREIADIFAIQDEIAMAITEQLKITLLEDEKAFIYKDPSQNKEAYDLYLKGRFYFNKRGAGIVKGIEYFHLALEKDPALTLAYTGLADAYCILALYCVVPPHDAIPKAKKFALKALELQPGLVEAYTALAFISTFYDWDWPAAKKGFARAFNINSNYASAYYWYSYYLSFVEGKYEEAIATAKKPAEIVEPLVPISHHILSIMYMNAGKYEEGVRSSKMAIELDANSFPGFRGLGLNLAGLNKVDEAIEALNTAVQLSNRQPLPMVELAWACSLVNNNTEIQKIYDELISRSDTEYISSTFLGCIAFYLKKYDESFAYLTTAFNQRDCTFPCINRYPLSSFMKTDSRFRTFLNDMHFPA
jgi:TolB-like protein